MFFNFHLELESGNNVCNSIFKKIYFGDIISPSATPRSGEGIHYAEHYFIIEDVAVHRGLIDLKV